MSFGDNLIPDLFPKLSPEEIEFEIATNLHIVQCLTTNNDLKKGDANVKKMGFTTRTEIPKGAKLNRLSLPGFKFAGAGNCLVATTYLKNTERKEMSMAYYDMEEPQGYDELNEIVLDPVNGFKKMNDSIECILPTNHDGLLLDIPFAKPFIYEGQNLEVAQYLNVKDLDRKKSVAFCFAKAKVECDTAAVYYCMMYDQSQPGPFNRIGQSFWGGRNWPAEALDDNMTHLGDIVNFFDLKTNEQPAAQFDFYTNDIRGIIKRDNAPFADKTVCLYNVSAGAGKTMVGKQMTGVDGKFEFLNLDHTGKYVVEVDSYTLPETELAFGSGEDAIQNDLEVEIAINLPTGVNDVSMAKTVTAVKYYSVQGIEGNEPFAGVNVVVTTYSDGSKTTCKIVK